MICHSTPSLVISAAMLSLCASPLAQARPSVRGAAFCGATDRVQQRLTDLQQGVNLPGASQRARGAADCDDNPRPTYPGEQTYTDSEYGFTIHYTTDSSDDAAVSEGDVQLVAAVMREVMDVEQIAMGFSSPPDDAIDSNYYCDDGFGGDGGGGEFDVYFISDDTLYGYAQPMTDLDDGTGAATSFLALSTWILDSPGALEVTVAHEFFHSVQFKYDSWEDAAWMESSATWMEEQIYPAVNDYINYLEDAFYEPEAPLDTFSNSGVIQYGNAIWPLYVTDSVGQAFMRQTWEGCVEPIGENFLEVQQGLLDDQYEGGFVQALVDFRAAMIDTSVFADADQFPEEPYFWDEDAVEGRDSLEYTGAHFIRLLPGEQGEPLTVCFEADDDLTRAKVMLDRGANDRRSVGALRNGEQLDVSEYATDDLVLVVARGAIDGDARYAYSSSLDDQCDPPRRCGCDSGKSAPASGVAWFVIALGLGLVRRRQR